MHLSDNVTKFAIAILGLLILVVLLSDVIILISQNRFLLIKSVNYIDKTVIPLGTPAQGIADGKEVIYDFFIARLENVAQKRFLLQNYYDVTLRPVIGKDYSKDTFILTIPGNLQAIGQYPKLPESLSLDKNKLISIRIAFNKNMTNSYTFYDVQFWQILGYK